jgi:hypothetical protein
MSTVNNNNYQNGGIITTTFGLVSNSPNYTSNVGILYNSPGIEQEKIIQYIDLMAQLLGININFEKFSDMTPEEIKSFTRDLKLKKLID